MSDRPDRGRPAGTAGEPSRSVVPIVLRTAPENIAYVKFLFESHEEVGIVRTIDRHTAVIVVLVVPDFLDVARAIATEVCAQVACEEVSLPAVDTDDWLMREIAADD
jgi:hypothetical protein